MVLPFGFRTLNAVFHLDAIRFALLALALATSMILQRFDLEFVEFDRVTPDPLFSLTPKSTVHIRIRKMG